MILQKKGGIFREIKPKNGSVSDQIRFTKVESAVGDQILTRFHKVGASVHQLSAKLFSF